MFELKRSATCWSCQHMGMTKDKTGTHGTRPSSCFCEFSRRWVSLQRGQVCSNYIYKQWHSEIARDGILIKNRQPLDYRTRNQWLECGRELKGNAIGIEMYSTKQSKRLYKYYLIDETEEI